MFGRRKNRTQPEDEVKQRMRMFYVNVETPGVGKVQYMVELPDDVYSSDYLERMALKKGTRTGSKF